MTGGDGKWSYRAVQLKEATLQSTKALKGSAVVLYSLRHTLATRIAPHVDAWTLSKIMGWASLSVAMRYIHPSEERVLAAFAEPQFNQGGDKIGDSRTDCAPGALLAGALSAVASGD